MPHTCLGRAGRAEAGARAQHVDELEAEHARGARAACPASRSSFTTPLGHAHRRRARRHAGRPVGAHLRARPRRSSRRSASRRERDHERRSTGIEDLRAEAADRACRSCASTSTAAAAARVGLTPGDVDPSACAIGLVGEEVSEVWVGQRRYDLVVRLAGRPARDSVAAIAALLIDGHDGTRIPLEQLARDRGDVRPRHHPARSGQPADRRRGQRRRPRPRRRGARGPRERSRARARRCRPATSSTSAAGSSSRRARSASLTIAIARRAARGVRAALPRARLVRRDAA